MKTDQVWKSKNGHGEALRKWKKSNQEMNSCLFMNIFAEPPYSHPHPPQLFLPLLNPHCISEELIESGRRQVCHYTAD